MLDAVFVEVEVGGKAVLDAADEWVATAVADEADEEADMVDVLECMLVLDEYVTANRSPEKFTDWPSNRFGCREQAELPIDTTAKQHLVSTCPLSKLRRASSLDVTYNSPGPQFQHESVDTSCNLLLDLCTHCRLLNSTNMCR